MQVPTYLLASVTLDAHFTRKNRPYARPVSSLEGELRFVESQFFFFFFYYFVFNFLVLYTSRADLSFSPARSTACWKSGTDESYKTTIFVVRQLATITIICTFTFKSYKSPTFNLSPWSISWKERNSLCVVGFLFSRSRRELVNGVFASHARIERYRLCD